MRFISVLFSIFVLCCSHVHSQQIEDNTGISVRDFYNGEKGRVENTNSTESQGVANPPPADVFYPDCVECLEDEVFGSTKCQCSDFGYDCSFDMCLGDCDIPGENGLGIRNAFWYHWSDSLKNVLPLEFVPFKFNHLYYDKYYKTERRCSSWTETGKDMDYKEAILRDTRGDETRVIAIIDTGIDFSYNDLKGRRWENKEEIEGNGIDDDDNGYVDDKYGYDFTENTGDRAILESLDNDVHGTLMARVIGSNDSREVILEDGFESKSEGYYGIGIDVRSKIMNLKVFKQADQLTNAIWVSEAIRYAVDNGAQIINVSIGGGNVAIPRNLDYNGFKDIMESLVYKYEEQHITEDVLLMREAAQYAWDNGALVVVPSGNNTAERAYQWNHYGLIVHPSTITVSGIKSPEMYFDFTSSYHGKKTDVVVPHVISDGDFTTFGGTSLATAAMSGVLSIVWAEKPELKNHEIKQLLLETARDQIFDTGLGKLRADCEMIQENWDWSYSVLCAKGDITLDDEEGWDQYYGYGLPQVGAMLDEERVRSVPVAISDGSVPDYSMKDEFDTTLIPLEYQPWKDAVFADLNKKYITGLEEEGLESASYVYPNPTRGKLKLSQSLMNESVAIYDGSGREIEVSIKNSEVDLEGYKRGIYILKTNTAIIKIIKL